MTTAERFAAHDAAAKQGAWYPACGGTEVPFATRSGVVIQYMYQPATGTHAYYRVHDDLFVSNEEAFMLLGLG